VALKVLFAASYHDSPDRVSSVVLRALAAAADIRRDPPPAVQLADFGDHALNYLVKFWIDDYSRHRIVASDVRRRIWYAFKRQGIEIPFPRRDVFMRGERAEAIPPAALAAELQRNDVLREIGVDRLAELLAAAETMVFGAGETIIREGDDGDYFYHVYSGEVHVLKQGQVIARLRAGDFFGEISLVTGEKINATVVAESESVLILVSSARFKQVVDMNEAMAQRLSALITRRQEEMQAFSEKNLAGDHAALKKDSEKLFTRILKYFAGKK
jgi:CRP-like cAMP-binding protein